MSRNPKAAQDDAEAEADDIAEAQSEMEEQINDELAMWDAAIAYGHIPGLSSFGFPEDDYATYVGPSYKLSNKNEQDMSCSKDDWQAFLKKIEEDLE
ncbi:MAG: hypothetical protein DRQ39_05585 [Gammaproteobacteria bacterium]|nr:MAG: hypothetical protein DRQ39_05585 [Gammaproteobacteria bacterium]